MKQKLVHAMQQLKANGYKYTRKREEMMQFFIDQDRYLSAKEVYEFMNQQYPGISYDTIYRNLKDFSEINLLEETEWDGEKKFRFHCCHDNGLGHHHHFICLMCGATREISMCPMDFFEDQLTGCEIEEHRFEIYGKCEKCSKKSKNE